MKMIELTGWVCMTNSALFSCYGELLNKYDIVVFDDSWVIHLYYN